MSNLPSTSSPLAQPPHVRFPSGDGDHGVPPQAANRSRPQQLNSRALLPKGSSSGSETPPGTPRGYASTTASNAAASTERLLPPTIPRHGQPPDGGGGGGGGGQRFHEAFPEMSAMSSRRTSFDSDAGGSRRSHLIYSPNPFEDSRPVSRAGSDDDMNLNTQTVSEKYNILPSAGLLLFPEDVEKDDYLHNPDPNEKEKRECDIFSKRGIVNVGGLAFLLGGILMLFVGYPVMYGSLGVGRQSSCRT